jgi:hypothetical protein
MRSYFPDGVPATVEQRMTAVSVEQGTATRRARAEALLAQHEAWKQGQEEKEARTVVEHNRRRLQLEAAKLL